MGQVRSSENHQMQVAYLVTYAGAYCFDIKVATRQEIHHMQLSKNHLQGPDTIPSDIFTFPSY